MLKKRAALILTNKSAEFSAFLISIWKITTKSFDDQNRFISKADSVILTSFS